MEGGHVLFLPCPCEALLTFAMDDAMHGFIWRAKPIQSRNYGPSLEPRKLFNSRNFVVYILIVMYLE